MSNNKKIITSPVFILTLVFLLLNDHLLKTLYPGWLTGKISDFAGLFVMAVFAYAIFGKLLKSNRSILIMHVIIGITFIIWKTAPVEVIFTEISRFVAIPLPSRVKDVSDLIALSILPFSYYYIIRLRGVAVKTLRQFRFRKTITIGILLITGLAIVATSPGRRYDIKPNVTVKTETEYKEILALFKQTLLDQGVEIRNEHALDDTTYHYKIEFKHQPYNHRFSDNADNVRYVSFVTLVYSLSQRTISIENIYGWVTYDLPEDKQLDKLYMNKIIEPFLEKIQNEASE